jgi:hypothetical protein
MSPMRSVVVCVANRGNGLDGEDVDPFWVQFRGLVLFVVRQRHVKTKRPL